MQEARIPWNKSSRFLGDIPGRIFELVSQRISGVTSEEILGIITEETVLVDMKNSWITILEEILRNQLRHRWGNYGKELLRHLNDYCDMSFIGCTTHIVPNMSPKALQNPLTEGNRWKNTRFRVIPNKNSWWNPWKNSWFNFWWYFEWNSWRKQFKIMSSWLNLRSDSWR